jgi:hypothetical protein
MTNASAHTYTILTEPLLITAADAMAIFFLFLYNKALIRRIIYNVSLSGAMSMSSVLVLVVVLAVFKNDRDGSTTKKRACDGQTDRRVQTLKF